jgi:hypothetical protein
MTYPGSSTKSCPGTWAEAMGAEPDEPSMPEAQQERVKGIEPSLLAWELAWALVPPEVHGLPSWSERPGFPAVPRGSPPLRARIGHAVCFGRGEWDAGSNLNGGGGTMTNSNAEPPPELPGAAHVPAEELVRRQGVRPITSVADMARPDLLRPTRCWTSSSPRSTQPAGRTCSEPDRPRYGRRLHHPSRTPDRPTPGQADRARQADLFRDSRRGRVSA